MKNNLRAIKYGSEEYITVDTKDLPPFEVTVRTFKQDQLKVSYKNQVVTVENKQDGNKQVMPLIHFEDNVSYVPVYGNYNYHKSLNLLEIDRIFNKLCKDNAINQAFLDRLQSEYPEELL